MDTDVIEAETIAAAPFAVAEVDAGGKLLAWNLAAERMFGVAQADAIGRPIGAVAPVPGGHAAWQAVLAAGKLAKITVDGSQTTQRTWTVQPRSDGGALCYGHEVAGATADAIQQKARDLLLRGMLDTLDIFAWVTDERGIGVLADGKGLARTGVTAERLRGQNMVDMYGTKYPQIHDGLKGRPVHFIAEEGAGVFENWGVPVHDEHGRQIALVGFAIDISKARSREDDLADQLQVIESQERAMRDMSTPVIQVWDHVLCMPLVGLVDTARTAEIMESLLQAVARTRARYAILDLSGVDVLDTATANHLIVMTRALRLLGAECVLTGMQPNIARTVVTIGVDLSTMVVRATMRDALKFVLGALEHPDERL
ncbi:MAG TPA: STAS domain-containing protein [Nannocystis sp.]